MAARNPPDLGDPERVVAVAFGCRPEEVAEDVALTPFLPLKAFRRHLDPGREVTELSPPFFYRGLTGWFGDRRVTVIATGVGPSRVGDCVGFLSLTPARRLLFAGAVGGLAPGTAIGDFFLPEEAADGEGYTRYVGRPFRELAASARRIPCLVGDGGRLEGLVRRAGFAVRRGPVFTVGSIAFESPANLRALAELGYAAVEMELSAFFAAVRHHGLGGAALTYVSDLPLGSSLWASKAPGEEEALRAAYRALPRLSLAYLAGALSEEGP